MNGQIKIYNLIKVQNYILYCLDLKRADNQNNIINNTLKVIKSVIWLEQLKQYN